MLFLKRDLFLFFPWQRYRRHESTEGTEIIHHDCEGKQEYQME